MDEQGHIFILMDCRSDLPVHASFDYEALKATAELMSYEFDGDWMEFTGEAYLGGKSATRKLKETQTGDIIFELDIVSVGMTYIHREDE